VAPTKNSYVVGLVVASAGKMAPVALLLVSFLLYLLRFMYSEAITALPMNGSSEEYFPP
jgi:hypothetical protein